MMRKHVRLSRSNHKKLHKQQDKPENISTETLLELEKWDEGQAQRRDTDLDLSRTSSIYDILEVKKHDQHTGDITKLDITPIESKGVQENKQKPDIEEVDCGEPFKGQRFYIDFTPIPGIDDDEELFQKNENFWNFAYSNKEMQKLMNLEMQRVSPDLNFPSVSSTKSFTPLSSKDILDGVYWLDKDEVDLTAANKPQARYCDDEDDDYFSDDNVLKKRQKNHGKLKTTLKIKKLPQRSSYDLGSSGSSKFGKAQLNKLNEAMDDFDLKNPKSFDPPGKVPQLITATLQRHPFRGVIPDSNNDVFKHYNSANSV